MRLFKKLKKDNVPDGWDSRRDHHSLFGVMELNQSFDNALGPQSANTLAAENDLLRQQLGLISPQVSQLEMQARQLRERADRLHLLLDRRKFVGDTLSSFTNAAKGSKPQSLIPAAKSFRP